MLLFLLSLPDFAKTTVQQWTLNDCIDYALLHNPDVQLQELSVKRKKNDLNTEKNSWLPQISMSTTQQYTYGRSLTYENTYTNTSTGQTDFSLTGKINLFDGLSSLYKKKIAEDLVRVEENNLANAKMTLVLNVAEVYLQILMDMQLLEVVEQQVTIDSLQTLRLQGLLKHGKVSYVDVAQQRANLQSSIASVVENRNQLFTDRLSLCQLMNLKFIDNFSIVKPDEDSLRLIMPDNANQIYEEAVNSYPDILSQKALISSSENKIKLSRSSLYPQLTFVGGIGTNYYKTNGMDNGSFGRQFKNNFCQEIQLQLTIPLFNRFETRNSIRQARIEKEENEILLRKKKLELQQKIAQIHVRAMNAYGKITSYTEAVKSNRESFKLVTKKYECGKATIVEFDDSKTKLLKAESNRLQSLFDFYYQCYLLKLYQNPDKI